MRPRGKYSGLRRVCVVLLIKFTGASYFFNRGSKTITTSDVRNPLISIALISVSVELNARLNGSEMALSTLTDFVIDIDVPPPSPVGSSSDLIAYYYLVDHQKKRQFWLEDVDTKTLGCPPLIDQGHLSKFFAVSNALASHQFDMKGHLINQHYWLHVEHFSKHRPLPSGSMSELVAFLKDDQMSSYFPSSSISSVFSLIS